MTPAQWYARGVRLLARTTLEAVRDPLGTCIGEDVARVAATVPAGARDGVVDPFAGSCGGLYSILRRPPGAEGIGFEVKPAIYDLTTRNTAALRAPIRLVPGNYRDLIGRHRFAAGYRIGAFLAPPWADALSAETGLDLGRAKPPVGDSSVSTRTT